MGALRVLLNKTSTGPDIELRVTLALWATVLKTKRTIDTSTSMFLFIYTSYKSIYQDLVSYISQPVVIYRTWWSVVSITRYVRTHVIIYGIYHRGMTCLVGDVCAMNYRVESYLCVEGDRSQTKKVKQNQGRVRAIGTGRTLRRQQGQRGQSVFSRLASKTHSDISQINNMYHPQPVHAAQ